MCGIAGFYAPHGCNEGEASSNLIRMRDRLIHRGPDDPGMWIDPVAGIALAHRRLSIIDPTPAGLQPMTSKSGRYVVVFNGEIYNHQELRKQLEELGVSGWRGHSDTETLLAAIDSWGLEAALKATVGMFALGLWDRQTRCLSLARERIGEKPLYYGWQNGVLLFGSELKALRSHPAFRSEIDESVLPQYLRHGYISAPQSVWKGIRKLSAGCIVSCDSTQTDSALEPTPYWSLADAISNGQANPFQGTDEDAINAFESQLSQAVSDQMVADVPLGAFLSGGIDSSTIVALMQAQSSRPIKTFTIGFDEAGYNEAEHAKAVAAHLGTDHTELYVKSSHAQDLIPRLPEIYDEPFGDGSALPTYLVSQLARQHVTVSLSGDGGDELLGGYSRYLNHKAERVWRIARTLPAPVRGIAAAVLRSPAALLAGDALNAINVRSQRGTQPSFVGRAELVANISECDSLKSFYRTTTSQWNCPPVTHPGPEVPYGVADKVLDRLPEEVHRRMLTDCLVYLPDDILVKVDRAAMAVSLETRVPLLDHRVVELAWRMPFSVKVRDGHGKWLLRQVLHRHVPRVLVDRPKKGFGVPVDNWLRGPLRDWAEDLLSESRLSEYGLLNPKPIRSRWQQHLKGQQNWRDSLWLVLMWQAWIGKEMQVPKASAA